MYALAHDRLGFRPAFLDTATCSIHVLRFAEALPAKATLIPGFERNGFFYTRAAAARALAEWVAP